MSKVDCKSCNVLLIEDDDIDAMNVERSFKRLGMSHSITRASNGADALDILRNTEWTSNNHFPNIVLLDLNLPRMNGLEFLDVIRDDKILNMLNVFVLTTSTSQHDLDEAYKRNVAGYFVKEFEFDRFVQAIKAINEFWLLSNKPVLNIKTPHILLVDDDEVICMVMQRVLVKSGYEITTVDNALEALELLESIHVDLIITDLSMPRMDGWEFVRLLHESDKHCNTPVIVATNNQDVIHKINAEQYGVHAVISKSMGAEAIGNQARAAINTNLE
ncbi:MAG: response regulator [Planctomycetes bacterium]|nr:response regulator [Planctomycetota bacterium]